MNEPANEAGILTLLDAARCDPPLRTLRFSIATIDAITGKFDIPASKREALRLCLEGAALVYEGQLRGPALTPDIALAKSHLASIRDHLDQLVALTEPIEIFGPDGLHIGRADRFKRLGMPDAVAYANGLQFLIAPFVRSMSSGWMTHDGHSIVELREWRQKSLQTVNSITAILSKMIDQPTPRPQRADRLLPLKMFALCLAYFWTNELRRDVSITRETVETKNKREIATKNVSAFADFCVMCYRQLGDGDEPNLRTPIEAARAHILKEREIRQAYASKDFERLEDLLRNWKDRIPLAAPFDFVPSG
jgi:hypothetical protein